MDELFTFAETLYIYTYIYTLYMYIVRKIHRTIKIKLRRTRMLSLWKLGDRTRETHISLTKLTVKLI